MNQSRFGHIVNGERMYTGEEIPVYNKYNGEQIASICCADEEVVKQAVDQAVKTFKKEKLTAYQRSDILVKAASLINERKDELALSIVREVGKTLKDANTEIERAVETFSISAEEAKRISGEGVPLPSKHPGENRMAFTVRVPVGVIGAITPFNMPFTLAAHKVAPAIAAGNTIVLKPAEIAPITAMKMIDILEEAGLPPGFINVINGLGQKTGQYLLEDDRVNMFTFTGSVHVGQHIKRVTGIRKVTLELGNNSPNIVHKDAVNLEQVAQLCAQRGLSTLNGQACISVQRLYVHQDIMEEFKKYLIQATEQFVVGDPENIETDIGPLISEVQAQRVEAWVNEAVKNGARVLCGGERNGAFYSPTILTDVTATMKVMCEEVFGPVINLIPYDDIDWVFNEANNSDYGLQVGLFTSNLQIAMKAAQELEFGGVIINDVSTYRSDWTPYGGVKNSGLGKEGPIYAIQEMTDEKTVVINL
ncbi:aldehyde dehydrogenase family protein [Alkalihalobacillus oceani]|uniref:aldehyde dehydrogenase family protein n=1 Tax=Halalkalibacter oceani TaxID=1653776 RepID=UPI00203EA3D1|nr:aldehyde dehydrogenase family protein [Halalkalibacter oceani]MCM3762087.1 aldehyde dehydrogenase family protein [Halalkalibacter oceani]